MDLALIFSAFTLLLCSPLAYAQRSPPSPPSSTSMAPAPAPAPAYANITQLLTVAGPFHTFLSNLQSTKVIETFQNMANNTKNGGITIFVPTDDAFNSLKKDALSKLTQDQLKQLLLFHALPKYYSLSEFKNLSQSGSTSTLAGGSAYSLNFTDAAGTEEINTGLIKTNLTSSMYSTPPLALYEVKSVLLPKAIFGNEVPLAPVAAPSPSPSPSPKGSPKAAASPSIPTTADSPSSQGGAPESPSSSHGCISSGIGSQLGLAISGVMVLFLYA